MRNFDDILRHGIGIHTSGTTGPSRMIYQSRDKLHYANQVARQSQDISKHSRIYTVCKIEHAGGLLAQTLPAYDIGASIEIETFNPYVWTRRIKEFTHTHLTPAQAIAITKTKAFQTLDLGHIWITCGSDPVAWEIIEAYVQRGAIFMANWGMTEIGPIAINTTFHSLKDVTDIKSKMSRGTVLGNTAWCEHKVVDGELHVRGDISVFGSTWYATGDMVEETTDNYISFISRKSDIQNG